MFSRKPQSLSDAVGGFEANSINITFELIGIFLDSLKGCISIGFVDFDGQICADAMSVQKHHDLLDLFLLLPGDGDSLHAVTTNPRHLQQVSWGRLDHSECIFLESPDDTFSQFRTNALDHSRAEITLDASNGGRQGLFTDFCFELRAMCGMPAPLPLQLKEFSR